MPKRTRILFLCTGNSARSIMAEAIANAIYGDDLDARSAGSKPKGAPHPLALATLAAHGLPTRQCRSKSWEELKDESFDLVITLCDSAAAESCPTFPGGPAHAHWGFPDPPEANDPEAAFEDVFAGLMDAIEAFTAPPHYDAKAKAAIVARQVQDRYAGSSR